MASAYSATTDSFRFARDCVPPSMRMREISIGLMRTSAVDSNGATIPALRSVPRSRPGASAPSRYGRYETGRSCAAPGFADEQAQPCCGLAAGGDGAGMGEAPLRQSEAQGQGRDAVGHRAFSFSPLSSSSAFAPYTTAPSVMRAAGTVTGASTYIHVA